MKYSFSSCLIGSLAGIGLTAGTAAVAADLPVYAPPPPVFTWTGPYLGAQVGGAFAGATSINASPVVSASFGRDGVFGGLHLGYNYQVGAFVLGLQAEYNLAGVTGSTTAGAYTFNSSLRQFGSVDARLGIAAGRWLIYAIGGFAYSDPRHSIFSPAPAAVTRDYAANGYGWDVGGGVEYAFYGNWTARLEYRYYNWGSKGFTDTLSYGVTGPLVGVLPYHTTTETMHTVRAGLTYKFGWPAAPVVATY